jgi:bifunctional DNA-binding transcriptional regulator/antitoxin component of YhaV-PrlF toxin-antitoxin module
MPRGHTTKLAPANTTSDSLRTTIPAGVVKDLELERGDTVRWVVRARGDGRLVVEVEKEDG